MFGYATDETEQSMPLTVVLSHQLNEKMAELRRNGTLWWAYPDTKSQVSFNQKFDLNKLNKIFCFPLKVTCEYAFDNGACVPLRVHTVVISSQHSEKVSLDQLRKDIMEHVIKPIIPAKYLDSNTIYHINPCGLFIFEKINNPHGLIW